MGKTYQSFGISISILPVQCPMFKAFQLEQLEIEELENNIIQSKERTEEIKDNNKKIKGKIHVGAISFTMAQ